MTKNTIKEQPQPEEKPKQKRKGNIITRTFGAVMSGSFLSREKTIRALPFIFFLTFIAICYISNGYYAEEQVRKIGKLTNELKELHSDYIVSKSNLATVSNQTFIENSVLPMGIKAFTNDPPKIILVKDSLQKHQSQ